MKKKRKTFIEYTLLVCLCSQDLSDLSKKHQSCHFFCSFRAGGITLITIHSNLIQQYSCSLGLRLVRIRCPPSGLNKTLGQCSTEEKKRTRLSFVESFKVNCYIDIDPASSCSSDKARNMTGDEAKRSVLSNSLSLRVVQVQILNPMSATLSIFLQSRRTSAKIQMAEGQTPDPILKQGINVQAERVEQGNCQTVSIRAIRVRHHGLMLG